MKARLRYLKNTGTHAHTHTHTHTYIKHIGVNICFICFSLITSRETVPCPRVQTQVIKPRHCNYLISKQRALIASFDDGFNAEALSLKGGLNLPYTRRVGISVSLYTVSKLPHKPTLGLCSAWSIGFHK